MASAVLRSSSALLCRRSDPRLARSSRLSVRTMSHTQLKRHAAKLESTLAYSRRDLTLVSLTEDLPVIRAAAASSGASHFILLYAYVPDILEKRDPHREGHLNAIKEALKAEKLVIGGAIADPIDSGLLVFQNSTREEVEEYAKADPYFTGGLVTSYSIRPYMIVKA